jgi:hypothetical protein
MDSIVAEAPANGSVSPFVGAGFVADTTPASLATDVAMPGLVSPFAESYVDGRSGGGERLVDQVLNELDDESFEDAVAALIDEAAALHLSTPWASESNDGTGPLDAWARRLTTDAQRLLEHIEQTFAERTPDSISEAEIDRAAAEAVHEPVSPAMEQLFGGLVNALKKGFNAAKQVVSTVATTGLGVLAKFTGLSQITGILRKLVDPLVRRVLAVAMRMIPASLQGPAKALAAKLGIAAPATAGEVVDEFNQQFAEALTAPHDTALEQLLASAGEASRSAHDDPLAALDVARARLAEQLRTATPGEAPVVQVEQFIPAVMAAMPLVRMAIGIIGRDRIKALLASPLAHFIAPFVGDQAAKSLAPHIAGAGMKLLHLDHEDPATLGSEALVSALEDSIRQVLALPAEALDSDLRIGAEVQEAFAEAAARYLPPRLLRADLDGGEAEAHAGGWIMMPRGGRYRYRYRAYTRPIRIVVTRPMARTVVFASGDTLEDRLLDEGVTTWPTEADVHLYEAVAGTHLGHIAGEAADPSEGLATGELGELTPEVAGVVLGAPALGRRVSYGRGGGRIYPGQRFFRVLLPGQVPGPAKRRVRRIGLHLDLTAPKPVLRVHLRIGERAAHAIAAQLDQRALAQAIATIRRLLGPDARTAIAHRLGRLGGLDAPQPPTAEWQQTMAETIAEAMLTALAKELPGAGPALTKAAQDPAPGLTLTFAFPFNDRAELLAGKPGAPTLTIRPGYCHG